MGPDKTTKRKPGALAQFKEAGERNRRLREKARAARKATGKAYVKTSATPTKVLARPKSKAPSYGRSKLSKAGKYPITPSLAHPVSPAGTKPIAHASRGGSPAVSKTRGAGGTGFNLVAVNNSKARSAPTYNGGYSTAYKAPDGAIRGTPSTSKMVRTSSKALPLMSSTPPMPRGKVTKSSGGSLPLGKRIGAALAANKGNIQGLAKARMIAAGRRG